LTWAAATGSASRCRRTSAPCSPGARRGSRVACFNNDDDDDDDANYDDSDGGGGEGDSCLVSGPLNLTIDCARVECNCGRFNCTCDAAAAAAAAAAAGA
jgi:hypothetical protein